MATKSELLERNCELQRRLDESEDILRALREGEVDGVVTSGPGGNQIFMLSGADRIYRIMMEEMAEGALTVTPAGLIVFSNNQFASLLGLPLKVVIGASIHDFIAAEDRPALAAMLAMSSRIEAAVQLNNESGTLIPAHISAKSIRCDEHIVVCLIVTDLREQEQRNQEIQAAERLANAILDQSAGAIVVVDQNGDIIRASRAAVDITGGTIVAHRFDDVFRLQTYPDNRACNLETILNLMHNKPIYNMAVTARMPDDGTRDLMLNASCLSTGQTGSRYIILLYDVSQLRRSEREVRDLSEHQGLALEAASLSSWEYRILRGTIVWDEIRNEMVQTTGGGEATGGHIHPEDWTRARSEIRRAIAGVNKGKFRQEFRFVREDGSIGWFSTHGQVRFAGTGGTASRIVGVNSEITERKAITLALELSLREKTILLQEVHHRVKNNLAIMASLLSLQAQEVSDVRARSMLEESQSRVHSMALIHQHLYGGASFDRVNFPEYVRELVQGIHSTFASGRAHIAMELDIDSIDLTLEQAIPCALILNELLSNSFKHAFPNSNSGTIHLSFGEVNPGFFELVVEDNGVGYNHKTAVMGPSLGLRIIEILTRQLDGTLERQPRSGSHVLIRFPTLSPQQRLPQLKETLPAGSFRSVERPPLRT